MSVPRRLILFAVFGVVLLGCSFDRLVLNGPFYRWLPVSIWSADLGSDSPEARARAQQAFREAGTNALPSLLAMLDSRDSYLRMRLQTLAAKQSIVELHFMAADIRRAQAIRAFELLQATAKPAIPALAAMLTREDDPSCEAARALAHIGLEGIAPLIKALKHDQLSVRSCAIRALVMCQGDAKVVVPALIPCLQDKEVLVRYAAAEALGKFGNRAKAAAPALLDVIAHDEGSFGDILQIRVRDAASDALKQIDPEAAVNVGIK